MMRPGTIKGSGSLMASQPFISMTVIFGVALPPPMAFESQRGAGQALAHCRSCEFER